MPGYFYFNDNAPGYPDWHFFGSRNWHAGDGTPWPEFGEIESAKQTYYNGGFATRFPELVTIGTAPMIAGDLPCTEPGPTLFNLGVDVRCWPHGVPWVSSSIGGDLAGGSADRIVTLFRDAAGGDELGGSALHAAGRLEPAAGGDELGGSAVTTIVVHGVALGGDLAGGQAVPVNVLFRDGSGGDATGGFATCTISLNRDGRGGAQDNGTGIHHPP